MAKKIRSVSKFVASRVSNLRKSKRRSKEGAPVQPAAAENEAEEANDFFEDDATPGISGAGVFDQFLPGFEEEDDEERKLQDMIRDVRETNLHKVLFQCWGNEQIADELFLRAAEHLDVNSAHKKRNGFSVQTHGGHTIKWGMIKEREKNGQKTSYEAIKGKRIGFAQEDADAMVALAIIHGWPDLKVHGRKNHKEKLWLAAQMASLPEMLQFEQQKAAGQVPEGQAFTPSFKVSNFNPNPDSPIYNKWVEEQKKYLAKHMGIDDTYSEDPMVSKGEPAAPDAEGSSPDANDPSGADPSAKDADADKSPWDFVNGNDDGTKGGSTRAPRRKKKARVAKESTLPEAGQLAWEFNDARRKPGEPKPVIHSPEDDSKPAKEAPPRSRNPRQMRFPNT